MTRSSEPASPSVTPALYRATLGLFATGVTVVTMVDPETGETRGMTANAFMSVSLDPPLVLVSVRRQASLHAPLLAAGRYGVSLLGQALEREARRFAKLPVADHELGPEFELHSGVPVLRHALAWLVARITDAHPAGDHTLLIGEVVDLAPGRADQPPLGFFRSRFADVAPIEGEGPVPLEPWDSAGAWG